MNNSTRRKIELPPKIESDKKALDQSARALKNPDLVKELLSQLPTEVIDLEHLDAYMDKLDETITSGMHAGKTKQEIFEPILYTKPGYSVRKNESRGVEGRTEKDAKRESKIEEVEASMGVTFQEIEDEQIAKRYGFSGLDNIGTDEERKERIRASLDSEGEAVLDEKTILDDPKLERSVSMIEERKKRDQERKSTKVKSFTPDNDMRPISPRPKISPEEYIRQVRESRAQREETPIEDVHAKMFGPVQDSSFDVDVETLADSAVAAKAEEVARRVSGDTNGAETHKSDSKEKRKKPSVRIKHKRGKEAPPYKKIPDTLAELVARQDWSDKAIDNAEEISERLERIYRNGPDGSFDAVAAALDPENIDWPTHVKRVPSGAVINGDQRYVLSITDSGEYRLTGEDNVQEFYSQGEFAALLESGSHRWKPKALMDDYKHEFAIDTLDAIEVGDKNLRLATSLKELTLQSTFDGPDGQVEQYNFVGPDGKEKTYTREALVKEIIEGDVLDKAQVSLPIELQEISKEDVDSKVKKVTTKVGSLKDTTVLDNVRKVRAELSKFDNLPDFMLSDDQI